MLRYFTRHHKRLRFTYIKVATAVIILAAFFLPNPPELEQTGANLFTIFLNGQQVGVVADASEVEDWVWDVRRELASQRSELMFTEVDLRVEGQEVLLGEVEEPETVIARMYKVMEDSIQQSMQRAYVVKVNDYLVSLSSEEEAEALLQAAISQYDTEGIFGVELVRDPDREFNVLTAQIEKVSQEEEEETPVVVYSSNVSTEGGIQGKLFSMFEDVEPAGEKSFDDYEYGLLSMSFAEEVEIAEAYINGLEVTPLDIAIEQVTKEQEVNQIYEVVSGDTLSEISIKVNIPMDKLIEMNDSLKDEKTILKIGQQLIITVPEPELSVERTEQIYLEEVYEADIIYLDRDDWYTTKTNVVQEPSAGFRKIVAMATYLNNKEVSREIVMEEVVMEAVPKIVERGTKVPPKFIKPISGGRLTSSFGKRSAPTKGASTYHQGVDWAIATGSKVVAAASGTVTKAGWTSSGGYCVYINHGDGKETRYKHLSKVLVKVGEKVTQGQQIAKSGNTGVSTGPHLHFEIRLNGTAVNPLKYID